MKRFQFAQMVPNVPKFEWSCFNYQMWLRLLEFSQMFLIVRKFQRNTYILPKLEWSCSPKANKAVWSYPKMNKAAWSYPKLNEGLPLGPNLNVAIAIWPELI